MKSAAILLRGAHRVQKCTSPIRQGFSPGGLLALGKVAVFLIHELESIAEIE